MARKKKQEALGAEPIEALSTFSDHENPEEAAAGDVPDVNESPSDPPSAEPESAPEELSAVSVPNEVSAGAGHRGRLIDRDGNEIRRVALANLETGYAEYFDKHNNRCGRHFPAPLSFIPE